jgi:glutamate/tyrosine decarboxylase-like PLP-dependent enzyme
VNDTRPLLQRTAELASDYLESLETRPVFAQFSRRARAFAVYAALRTLGRTVLAELVERTCAVELAGAELTTP